MPGKTDRKALLKDEADVAEYIGKVKRGKKDQAASPGSVRREGLSALKLLCQSVTQRGQAETLQLWREQASLMTKM
jgi:hypothetical protein